MHWAVYFFSLLFITMVPAKDEKNSTSSEIEKANTGVNDASWAAMPIMMRTEATGFGVGGAGMHFLPHKDTTSHKSSHRYVGIFTTEKQWLLSGAPDIWFSANKYHLTGEITYRYWPQEYFGMGNNSSESLDEILGTQMATFLGVERGWQETWYLGLKSSFTYQDIVYPENGIIDNTKPTGHKGGVRTGLGITSGYDTRNNVHFPTKGILFQTNFEIFNEYLGSDFNFQRQGFGFSNYYPTGTKSTLALKIQGETSQGRVPFYDLFTPNGETILRGIQAGRYRDKNMVAALAEYRFPLWKILNAGVFADMAQVAHQVDEFEWEQFKYGVGAGLHIAVMPQEMIQLRLDGSYVDGGFSFIIAMMEAF